MSPRVHLFATDINQGMKRQCNLKISLLDPRDGKIPHRFSTSRYRKKNFLRKWKMEMGLGRQCVKFVIAG